MSYPTKISIIIPVFNGGRFLRETVAAVFNQSFDDFELLIINDGSTDNTREIATALQKECGRIVYFEKENSGVSATRNLGLTNAKGEFVVFLDADDLVHPDFLQLRFNFLNQNTHLDFCGSGIELIDADSKSIKSAVPMRAPGGKKIMEEILFYQRGIATVPSNFMFRKEILTQNQILFDTRLSSSADRFFLCKVAKVSQCGCLPGSSVSYRIHANSMYHDQTKKKNIFIDNEFYIMLLIKEAVVPPHLMANFLKKSYYMLGGAAYKMSLYKKMFLYGFKYSLARLKYLI
jgi:glycosyltransferase involved in cell wall biosynthesis